MDELVLTLRNYKSFKSKLSSLVYKQAGAELCQAQTQLYKNHDHEKSWAGPEFLEEGKKWDSNLYWRKKSAKNS